MAVLMRHLTLEVGIQFSPFLSPIFYAEIRLSVLIHHGISVKWRLFNETQRALE